MEAVTVRRISTIARHSHVRTAADVMIILEVIAANARPVSKAIIASTTSTTAILCPVKMEELASTMSTRTDVSVLPELLVFYANSI